MFDYYVDFLYRTEHDFYFHLGIRIYTAHCW